MDHLETEIKLIFEDDGIGFDIRKNMAGIGLKNVKNRLVDFEGKIFVDSKQGRGTVITIDIPITFSSLVNNNVDRKYVQYLLNFFSLDK